LQSTIRRRRGSWAWRSSRLGAALRRRRGTCCWRPDAGLLVAGEGGGWSPARDMGARGRHGTCCWSLEAGCGASHRRRGGSSSPARSEDGRRRGWRPVAGGRRVWTPRAGGGCVREATGSWEGSALGSRAKGMGWWLVGLGRIQ